MVLVLALSNDRSIDRWSVQPTVYLAIASTVANIALHFGLSQGVTNAWWVKAMKPDSTVRDLHNIWSFGSSMQDALFAGRSFNLVALASLAVAVAPINGPFLQRASVVTVQTEVQAKNLTIPIAQVFPAGFTGIISGRSHVVGLPTLNFSSIANDFNVRRPINVAGSGCMGTCTGRLLGAGYSVQCINNTVPYDISTDTQFDTTTVFSTNFTYNEFQGGLINFTAVVKPERGCTGSLYLTKCTLLPATIEYPVLLTNDIISLDPSGSFKTDRVIAMHPVWPNYAQGPTTHGGMYLVLDSLFNSNSFIQFDGAVGYETRSSGSAAFGYSRTELSNWDCNITWIDPTLDMLSVARELAFRSALFAAANNVTFGDDSPDSGNTIRDPSEYIQHIQVHQSTPQTVFKSHHRFLAVALVFTLFAAFSVVPIFLGWWSLGRNVSLSPIETAKAFAAPALARAPDANAELKPLLREVGDLRLRYGAVAIGEGAGAGAEVGVPAADGAAATLRFEAPERCFKPQEGRVYVW
jgi:hypothetical protein